MATYDVQYKTVIPWIISISTVKYYSIIVAKIIIIAQHNMCIYYIEYIIITAGHRWSTYCLRKKKRLNIYGTAI